MTKVIVEWRSHLLAARVGEADNPGPGGADKATRAKKCGETGVRIARHDAYDDEVDILEDMKIERAAMESTISVPWRHSEAAYKADEKKIVVAMIASKGREVKAQKD